jgi:pyruvate kinase
LASQGIRKTKVIATIGPASDSPDTLAAMIEAGMNVARLNLSHGSHDEHGERIARIRAASQKLDANIAIMLDTKGVEIRTGLLAGGSVHLAQGEDFRLYAEPRPGNASGVSLTYPNLASSIDAGARVLLDDGAIELEALRVEDRDVVCRVIRGGPLESRKGVNVPGTPFELSPVSPENQADLRFAVDHEVVYLAASFVRHAHDVQEIRAFLDEAKADIRIIAKIESAEGLHHIREIVAAADGIMVARGDLGVEIPVQEVPVAQKRIIRTTVMSGKPVITATQMLDSMTRNPMPTRAEVSDVANAILDGTSAVMLSNETAVGSYPVEAVRTMAALALEAEAALDEYGHLQHIQDEPANVMTDAISQAAITLAKHLKAKAIVALTESGGTARAISKHRPRQPILGITMWPEVARRLALNWGVTGVLCEHVDSGDAMLARGLERAKHFGYLAPGDTVVVTAGTDREPGTTNQIRVVTVP